jgi:hypothetical protein
VLRAFGADPNQPESIQAIDGSTDPWVAVLDVDGAVLAVEYNGWQGSNRPVLARASSRGRAASMYWNVNAVTRLSFAEHGEVLLSVEPFDDIEAPPPVAGTLVGLAFADYHRGKQSMGLVAVQRFTGYGMTADDLARIEAADIAFRIVPDLPTLYPYQPQRGHQIGPIVETLTGLPEAKLRDLAWWAAAEAVRYAGRGDDPDIAASLTARALTEARAPPRPPVPTRGRRTPLALARPAPSDQPGPARGSDGDSGSRPLCRRPARGQPDRRRPGPDQVTGRPHDVVNPRGLS